MKIFVTGGLGFIGSNYILKKIGDHSVEILNYDKITYAANIQNLSSLESNPRYHFIKGDICNMSAISKSINDFQPDIIVNFAAESHVDRSIDSPMEFIQTNVVGTTNLLEAALSYYNKLKNKDSFIFLHISTDEVFGELDNSGYFTELSSYDPSSPYSASKASSDHLARSWYKTYDFPVLITNCSNNYGPYQFPEKLIPMVIKKVLERSAIPIYGDGENIRDWLYVKDHCQAIIKVLESGNSGETYNIGGNNEIKNLDLVNHIFKEIEKYYPAQDFGFSTYSDLVEFVPDRPGHDKRYAIDSSKIKYQLGWQPTETFESGIKKTVKWYLENTSWVSSLKRE